MEYVEQISKERESQRKTKQHSNSDDPYKKILNRIGSAVGNYSFHHHKVFSIKSIHIRQLTNFIHFDLGV